MDLGLKAKNAIIFGASSGLGKAAAHSLASEGCNTTLVARDAEKLKIVSKEILQAHKVSSDYIAADLMKDNDVSALIEGVCDREYDILINNTGGPPPSNPIDTDNNALELFVKSILLNTIRITNSLIPSMIEKNWGRVITITSSGVVQPIDNLSVSNTIRPAVTGFMKTLSNQISEHGITVNTVMPGRITTERTLEVNTQRAKSLGISYDEAISISSNEIPLGRYGTPEEFASVLCFLASEKASYINGSNIRVDGGLIRSV
jgi:3-oxoacyl-[acyl-carrier protein] reductase